MHSGSAMHLCLHSSVEEAIIDRSSLKLSQFPLTDFIRGMANSVKISM